ncbi:MAG: TlpA disulfide reductase family protein [Alphaproteobacteria bacterium]
MSIFLLLATAQFAAPSARAGDLPQLVTGTMANFSLSAKPLPVPEINFRDDGGRERDLAMVAGKVVLINFWATWCGPCRREMPDLDQLQARLGGPEFTVLAISSDRKGMAVVQEFYRQYKIRHLGAYNDSSSKAQRAFRAFGLPTSVLLDGQGREIGRLVGPAEWSSDEATALIKAAISHGER